MIGVEHLTRFQVAIGRIEAIRQILRVLGETHFLDVQDRRVQGTAGAPCRLGQGAGHGCVGILQCRERESFLAVLMFQQPDNLLRARRAAVPPDQQSSDPVRYRVVVRGPRQHAVVASAQQQLVDQDDAVTGNDRPGLVHAIGVERSEGQLRRILGAQVDDRLTLLVADHQFAARPGDWQRDHQRGDHAGRLLAVAMGAEEPSRFVHQQLVQPRLGALARAPQALGGAADDLRQRVVPCPAAHVHLVRVDLPAVAHRAVQHRLRSPAVRRPFSRRRQRLGVGGRNGKGDQPGAGDLQAWQWREQPAVGAVFAGAVNRLQ